VLLIGAHSAEGIINCMLISVFSEINVRKESTSNVKSKKVKAVPLHAMKAFGGRGGIAPTHS
jgi:hypothetical protein